MMTSSAFSVRVIVGDTPQKFIVSPDESMTVGMMLKKAGVEQDFDDLDVSVGSTIVLNPDEPVTGRCTIVVMEHSANG
jgi:hypothetical protein